LVIGEIISRKSNYLLVIGCHWLIEQIRLVRLGTLAARRRCPQYDSA